MNIKNTALAQEVIRTKTKGGDKRPNISGLFESRTALTNSKSVTKYSVPKKESLLYGLSVCRRHWYRHRKEPTMMSAGALLCY
jgi:hypothetical protein